MLLYRANSERDAELHRVEKSGGIRGNQSRRSLLRAAVYQTLSAVHCMLQVVRLCIQRQFGSIPVCRESLVPAQRGTYTALHCVHSELLIRSRTELYTRKFRFGRTAQMGIS